MIKIIALCCWLLAPFSFAACLPSTPSTSASFCESFKSVAECHCMESGLPYAMCSDMNELYVSMIAMFHSIERACEFQQDTSKQDCMDDWQCYLSGGSTSQGGLCNGTGTACG